MTELEALTIIAESLNGIRIELLGIMFIILLFLFFKS